MGQSSSEVGTEQTFMETSVYFVVHTQLKPGERKAQSKASSTSKHPFIRRNLVIHFNHKIK